jgi:hypothetical protein
MILMILKDQVSFVLKLAQDDKIQFVTGFFLLSFEYLKSCNFNGMNENIAIRLACSSLMGISCALDKIVCFVFIKQSTSTSISLDQF